MRGLSEAAINALDTKTVVAVIGKNKREEIPTTLREFNCFHLFGLRVKARIASGSMPTGDGLNLRIECLQDLHTALVKAEKSETERWRASQ